jgi:hypothetical protein
MPPLNDYRETVGVLGFKQNGGRYCTIGRTFELAFTLIK